MQPVVIGSPYGLRLSNDNTTRDVVTVELILPNLRATTTVYELDRGPHPLVGYFQDIAANWRGWEGSKELETLEGDLYLSARHNGHIVVTARLRNYLEPTSWTATGDFHLDPGEEITAVASSLAETLS